MAPGVLGAPQVTTSIRIPCIETGLSPVALDAPSLPLAVWGVEGLFIAFADRQVLSSTEDLAQQLPATILSASPASRSTGWCRPVRTPRWPPSRRLGW